MRILFLVSSMQGGGAERIAAYLCNAWVKCGHVVTIIPTYSKRGEVSYSLDSKVELDFLADHVTERAGRLRRVLALRQLYYFHKPDIIVSFLTDVNVAALLAALGTGFPVIVSERTYPPKLQPQPKKFVQFLRKMFYPHAAAVVVQTSETANWITLNCPGSNTHIIPNPAIIDRTLSSPAGERRLILSMGRLTGSKRNTIILSSFAKLAKRFPEWNLAIVGDGPSRSDLALEIGRLGLSDRVALPGYCSEPSEWYSRAGIYVMASEYEGMPNTLIEAMAYGLPSIVFDVFSGPRDVTENGRLGILLPDENHEEQLMEALSCLMADEQRRLKLGRRAILVRDNLSPERILAAWDCVLHEAAIVQEKLINES